ncbi:MAG: hypothetical protein JRH15_22990 [Deltaproteobacteria bacterium]|nr:hypothetical protein [Deltaproteobacteria bacterium]
MNVAEEAFVIVCDDVRNEVGDKISLMGIYSRDVIVPKVPTILQKLSFVLTLRGIKKKFKSVWVTIKCKGTKEPLLEQKLQVDPGPANNLHLIAQFAPFRIDKTGVYRLEYKFSKKKTPDLVHEIEIKVPQ